MGDWIAGHLMTGNVMIGNLIEARSEGYMEIADMLDSVAKDKTSLSE